MTIAPRSQPLRFDTIEQAISAVRQRGMRLSTARRLVLEALFAAEGPVSAVHLGRSLGIDESSIYRNLEVLERNGLVRHVHLGHGPGLYVLVGSDEAEYLYCERCAKVTAVTPAELDPVREQIRERFGYNARFTHFAVVGLCEGCRATREGGARSGEARSDGARAGEGRADEGRAGGGRRHDPERAHSHGDFVHSHPGAGLHRH